MQSPNTGVGRLLSSPTKEDRLLTINDILEILNISRSTFYKIRKNGEFPLPAISRYGMRWDAQAIDEYRESRFSQAA
jgi:predicted DNA-binding transcriptional regulator AlpA